MRYFGLFFITVLLIGRGLWGQEQGSSLQRMTAGQLRRECRSLEKRLRDDPDPAPLWDRLTAIADIWQYKKGDRSRALLIFLRYNELYPNHSEVLFKIGRLYLWKNHHKKAITFLSRALRLSPEDTDIASLLVRAYIRSRKWSCAEALLGHYPDLPDGAQQRALIAFRRYRYAAAREYYQKILQEDPENIEATRGLARSLAAQNQFQKAKKQYIRLTRLEPRSFQNWKELAGVEEHTDVRVSLDGFYVKARENDPAVQAPVVKDYYTYGKYDVGIPVLDCWKIEAKQTFYHQKEKDIYPPVGLNYDVYIYGGEIDSKLFWRSFEWDLIFRFEGSRGYNHRAFFPYESKALFEPGTSLIYRTPLQYAILNAQVDAFIIKNFEQRVSQLLRIIDLHAGYGLHPDVILHPRLDLGFDEIFYHDSYRNRQNIFEMKGQVDLVVPFLGLVYTFRESNFKKTVQNYYSYRRQTLNLIGGKLSVALLPEWSIRVIYEHGWQYTLDLNQPIGSFVFITNKQWIQSDKVSLTTDYRWRDKLVIGAFGHLFYTTLPYRDFRAGGRASWLF